MDQLVQPQTSKKRDDIIKEVITKYQFQIYERWMNGGRTLSISGLWDEIRNEGRKNGITISTDMYVLQNNHYETDLFTLIFTPVDDYRYGDNEVIYSPFDLKIKNYL